MFYHLSATNRVDSHCHSSLSDAALAPEALAERIAAAGVVFASLTDHDTTDGVEQFRQRLARLGDGCVAGVEITAHYHGREVHLLAYGISLSNPELQAALQSLRRTRTPGN